MAAKHKLVRGALILTAAGLISRLMGFFFRIFLSHAFGEENVGLYQLVFPIYALCLSIGTSGIQTALSRTVARKMSLNKPVEAKNALICALFITVVLSAAEILAIQQNAEAIALHFLGDARCAELLVIISYALPCASVHSCICGYSYGIQKAGVPAVSQLAEQSVRILSVIFLYFFFKNQGSAPPVSLAVAGIVIGESASALCSARSLSRTGVAAHMPSPRALRRSASELIPLSLPLTANRTAVTLLQSIEAASIPACLKLYTHSSSEALILYGVLTGMALPCVLFPSAVTNSVAVMLMPAVAEKQAAGKRSDIFSLLIPVPQRDSRKLYHDPRMDLPVSLHERGHAEHDQRTWQDDGHFSHQRSQPSHPYRRGILCHTRFRDAGISVGTPCKPACRHGSVHSCIPFRVQSAL